MPVTEGFRILVLDQLHRVLPSVQARRMFGGVGLWSGELFFALIADDALYLKADETTVADFTAQGMEPFSPFGVERRSMRYYQLPADLLEDAESLAPWVEKALDAARRGAKRKG